MATVYVDLFLIETIIEIMNFYSLALIPYIPLTVDDFETNNSYGFQYHVNEAVQFFTSISQKYGGYPNIIYETYNEPLQVDWTSVLKPYHQQVINAIRANDPNNVIVLGTPTWSQVRLFYPVVAKKIDKQEN